MRERGGKLVLVRARQSIADDKEQKIHLEQNQRAIASNRGVETHGLCRIIAERQPIPTKPLALLLAAAAGIVAGNALNGAAAPERQNMVG